MSAKELTVGGKPLSSLRVVDLKEELEKKGLSKSGSKKDLMERLKAHLTTEKQREAVPTDDEQLPNISMQEKLADQNPYLRDYFASQAELFHSQKLVKKLYHEEKKRESEASADEGGDSPVKSRGESPMKIPSISPEKHESEASADTVGDSTVKSRGESPMKIPAISPDKRESQASADEAGDSPVKSTGASPIKIPAISPDKRASEANANETVDSPVKSKEGSPMQISPEKRESQASADEAGESPVKSRGESPRKITSISPEKREPQASADQAGVKTKGGSLMKISSISPEKRESETSTKGGDRGVSPIKIPPISPEKREPQASEVGDSLVKSVERSPIKIPSASPEKDESEARLPARAGKGGGSPVKFGRESPTNIPLRSPDKREPEASADKDDIPVKSRGGPPIKIPSISSKPESDTSADKGGDSDIAVKFRGGSPIKIPSISPDKRESAKAGDSLGKSNKSLKDSSPPPAKVAQDNNSSQKLITFGDSTDPPHKIVQNNRSSKEPSSAELNAAESRRRGGKTIVFDYTPSKPPPAKRTMSVKSTEGLVGDDILDFGEDEKEKKESEPERLCWTRRVIRVKNKATNDTIKEGWQWQPEGETKIFDSSWMYFKNTFYEDLEFIADDDLKLDSVDLSIPASLEEDLPNPDPDYHKQRYHDIQITRTISNEFVNNGIEEQTEQEIEDLRTKAELSLNHKISKIQIPIEEEERQLTPSRNPPSQVIKLSNLVRPFTLTQLRGLLQRTGNVVDIWVDKIKSKCVAKFEKEDEAVETRAALHGVKWPASNSKALRVDFSTEEVLDELRASELNEDRPKIDDKSNPASASSTREWDLGKSGRVRRSSRSASRDRKKARRSSKSPRGEHRDRAERDKKEPATTGKALDELFRKTVATPCIYWLPLTSQQIGEKEELRRKRMLERDRKIVEMNQQRFR